MLPTPPIASPHIQRIAECQTTVFTAAVERVRDALRTADVSLPMPETVVRTELRTAQLARQLGLSNADRVADAFGAALAAKPEAAPRTPAPRGGKTRLQLLDDDALDADLAMSKLVRKTVDEIDPETLAALDMRIGELQGSAPADRDSNPLGPRAVMMALFEATTRATEEVEVRLALMSLLQPHVAAALRGAYDTVNDALIAAGVLPDTTFRVKKDAPATPRNGPEIGVSQAMSLAELLPAIHGLPTTLELQRMLRGLVGRRTEPTPLAARILADARNAYHGAAVESPVDPETLAALMAMQQLRGIDTAGLDDLLCDEPQLDADPLATLRAATANDMAALDQLTGQLVAVVLEFVLHDPAVPEPVKRQIARLQIVAFRAALVDRTFFARRDHPFRQLLDRIATLAVEPQHAAEDSAFQNTLVRITDALVSDFRDDLSIFSEKLAELDATLDFADGTQAEAVAQAIQSLPELEALHGVRQRALAAIEPRLHPGTPPAIVAFLRNEWVDVLVATWRMRGGEAKWQEQMTLATRLLWSLQSHPKERLPELSRALPAIVGGIRRALEDASIPADRRNAILQHLFEAHQHIVRQARQPAGDDSVIEVDADELAALAVSMQPPPAPARTPLRTGFELTLMRDGEETRARIVAVGADRLLCVLAYADGTVSTERCDDLERRIDSGDVVLLSSPHGIVERALALMAEPDAHRVHAPTSRTPTA